MLNSKNFIENYPEYKAKKGEKYMSAGMLKHFKSKLMAWKEQIVQEMELTLKHLRNDSDNPADPSDRASQEEEFSIEIRTRDREAKLIQKISQSLVRIENGEYGYCEVSGKKIGIKRMEARPTATMTVEEKNRQENQERQGVA